MFAVHLAGTNYERGKERGRLQLEVSCFVSLHYVAPRALRTAMPNFWMDWGPYCMSTFRVTFDDRSKCTSPCRNSKKTNDKLHR